MMLYGQTGKHKSSKNKSHELTEGFQRCVLKTAQLRAQMPLLPSQSLPPCSGLALSITARLLLSPSPATSPAPSPPLPFSTLPYSLLRLNAQKEKKGHHFAN